MTESKGSYLGQKRKTIAEMTEQEWNILLEYASRTGQRVKVRSIDEITVDGETYSYSHICDGLDAMDAAENEAATRSDLYRCY